MCSRHQPTEGADSLSADEIQALRLVRARSLFDQGDRRPMTIEYRSRGRVIAERVLPWLQAIEYEEPNR